MHAVVRSGLTIGLVLMLLAPLGTAQAVTAAVGSEADSADVSNRVDAVALVGEPAPKLSLPSLRPNHDPVQLSDHLGKVVYLDFWSSWCVPCRRAMPHLDALRREFSRNDFEVVGVNVDPIVDDARRFLEQVPVSYPIASDPAGRAVRRFGVTVLPVLFLIDRAGVVQGVVQGDGAAGAQADLRAKLEQLIGEREVR